MEEEEAGDVAWAGVSGGETILQCPIGSLNIPSYLIKQDEVIELKAKEKFIKKIKDNIEASKERGLPEWLELDANNLRGKVLRLPGREDIQLPIKEQLIVELYSK